MKGITMSKKRRTGIESSSISSGGASESDVLLAPEGVELSITTYVRSDSTNLEIVYVNDGLTSLPLSGVLGASDATEFVKASSGGKLPLGATDWRFMTRAEIAEHKAAKTENEDLDEPNP
jgi:hypothetical protein